MLQKGSICKQGKGWWVLILRLTEDPPSGIPHEEWWCCWLDGTNVQKKVIHPEQIVGQVLDNFIFPETPKDDAEELSEALKEVGKHVDHSIRSSGNLLRIVHKMVKKTIEKEMKK